MWIPEGLRGAPDPGVPETYFLTPLCEPAGAFFYLDHFEVLFCFCFYNQMYLTVLSQTFTTSHDCCYGLPDSLPAEGPCPLPPAVCTAADPTPYVLAGACEALKELPPLTNPIFPPAPLLIPHSGLATLASSVLLTKCRTHPDLCAFALAGPSAVVALGLTP